MITAFAPAPPPQYPTAMFDLLTMLGLSSSLTWVADAGDAGCNTFGQTMTKQPPSTAPSIFLGNDATVDSLRDPTPTGVQGRQSTGEYWSSTCSSTGSPANRLAIASGAWADNMHKTGALFTFSGVFMRDNTDGIYLLSTCSGSSFSSIGVAMGITASSAVSGANHAFFSVLNGNGVNYAYEFEASSLNTPTNSIFFFAVSVDLTGNLAIAQINGTQETATVSYTSPSAGQSTFGASGIALLQAQGQITGSTGRIYDAAHWTRALSAAELMKLYTAQRAKYGF